MMQRLSAMENSRRGKVCWIASRVRDYYTQMGIEDGTIVRKLYGWGDGAIIACGEKHYAVSGIADGLGLIPEE